MADPIARLLDNPVGKQVVQLLGLPAPADLRRHDPDAPLVPGPLVLAALPGARVAPDLPKLLAGWDVDVVHLGFVDTAADVELPDELAASVAPEDEDAERTRLGALVLDVTGAEGLSDLGALHAFFHPLVRHLAGGGRAVVLADVPGEDPSRAAVAQGVEGFVRSLAKELRGGATANLVRVADGAEAAVDGPLRFLLSGRSAYVNGQPLVVTAPGDDRPDVDWSRPLAGRVAVVTGAARGIGAAIAAVLARDGAEVVCLDLPSMGAELAATANDVGGTAVQLDVTDEAAPAKLARHLRERHGGVDVVVHNAGVTRDKTIVGMDRDRWDLVMAVNIASQERLDAALLADDGDGPVLRDGGRIVGVASTSGIAGNRGQTNYAASKGAVIGRVRALAPTLAERGITTNAVAPGFIETDMTDRMPFAVREVGRRLNSLSQGGRPADVAEAIAFLASPRADGITGQVLRVCGQSLVGA